jgi:hypothetical protein
MDEKSKLPMFSTSQLDATSVDVLPRVSHITNLTWPLVASLLQCHYSHLEIESHIEQRLGCHHLSSLPILLLFFSSLLFFLLGLLRLRTGMWKANQTFFLLSSSSFLRLSLSSALSPSTTNLKTNGS